MQNTMELLDAALKVKSAAEWARNLKLYRTTLHTARDRGNLSPAIAYALAEEMGQNAEAWALIAAAESERDSACKARMQKRLAVRLASMQFGGIGRLRRCRFQRRKLVNRAFYDTNGNTLERGQRCHRVVASRVTF